MFRPETARTWQAGLVLHQWTNIRPICLPRQGEQLEPGSSSCPDCEGRRWISQGEGGGLDRMFWLWCFRFHRSKI